MRINLTLLAAAFGVLFGASAVLSPVAARDVTDLGEADQQCWDEFSKCSDAAIASAESRGVDTNDEIKRQCWDKLVDCRIQAKDDFYRCLFGR